MKEARDKTFIWISWLAKLLAGEIQCEFSCWFKAHFKYDRIPNDFNLVVWNMQHNKLVHDTRDELEGQGYEVRIEDQNAIKVKIGKAIVSAKPDIAATRFRERDLEWDNIIIDCKTGRSKHSDQIQVMLYMMYLPILNPNENGCRPWNGRVTYKGNRGIPIPSTAVNKSFVSMVEEAIAKLSTTTPARKVPSISECRKCDISIEDCPEKLKEEKRGTNEGRNCR